MGMRGLRAGGNWVVGPEWFGRSDCRRITEALIEGVAAGDRFDANVPSRAWDQAVNPGSECPAQRAPRSSRGGVR